MYQLLNFVLRFRYLRYPKANRIAIWRLWARGCSSSAPTRRQPTFQPHQLPHRFPNKPSMSLHLVRSYCSFIWKPLTPAFWNLTFFKSSIQMSLCPLKCVTAHSKVSLLSFLVFFHFRGIYSTWLILPHLNQNGPLSTKHVLLESRPSAQSCQPHNASCTITFRKEWSEVAF